MSGAACFWFASDVWMSRNVLPSLSFHSIRPLALRPRMTLAAWLGEVKTASRVKRYVSVRIAKSPAFINSFLDQPVVKKAMVLAGWP